MMTASSPHDWAADRTRMQALRELDILDTAPEATFDEVAHLAAELCGAPIALVSLIDDRRQWHKAAYGLALRELPLPQSFCAHARDESDVLEIPDTLDDPRFVHHPQVVGHPHLRFYAGSALRGVDGTFLGALCVLDVVPRALTAQQRLSLRVLAQHVSTLMQQRALVAQLERERARLAEAQSVARVGSWETDLTTLEVSWSAENHRIFGTDPATFQPTHAGFLALVHHDDRAMVDAAFVQSLQAAHEHTVEHRVVRPDQQQRIVEERWRVIADADGVPVRAVGTSQDITDRRRLEQQMFRAQRMESIGTLAGGVAHDLNNVLAPILLSIEMLSADERDPEKREILATIESSARRGADMVKQVLAFARGTEHARLSVPVGELVRSLAQIIRETFPRNIALRTDVAAELPPLVGDPTQIEQVLLNLAVNARDAMPYGGDLRIRVSAVELDTQFVGRTPDARTGPHVVIDVEDTGTGMAPEIVDRIFDPFFTTKAPGHGTGLGLSSSIAIVKGHGGFIHVYSEPGKGSRFRVYLPAADVVSGGPVRRSTPAPAPDLRGRGELILLVEDEEQVRHITRQTLETYGYRVLTATDGADAVAVFATHRDEIALVLTDLMMPVMDGTSMIEVLVRMAPSARIVAVSGLQDNALRLPAAVRHFLPKPFTAGTLLDTLRRALDH